MEYINKKWDLTTMEKKVESLKKVINPFVVDSKVLYYETVADNRLDALYLAFYDLKDQYCKVKRTTFGKPKIVDYKAKQIELYGTSPDSTWWSPSEYTWTISTSPYNTTWSGSYTIGYGDNTFTVSNSN